MAAVASTTYELWVNDERTILVRRWSSGTVEVCIREHPSHTWPAPITLKPEKV